MLLACVRSKLTDFAVSETCYCEKADTQALLVLLVIKGSMSRRAALPLAHPGNDFKT